MLELDNETNFFQYLNFTNQSEAGYIPYHSRPETYIVPVVFAIIFIIGVLGNGVLVLIFLKHKNMRNVPNTYIFSLALGDLLVIMTSVPFTSTIYTFESWPYGEMICKISECAKDVSIGVSVFTLTALSADRFFAIVDPMRKLHTAGGGRRATRCTIFVVAKIWLLAIALATPAYIFSHIQYKEVNQHTHFHFCYPYPQEYEEWYPKTVVVVKFVVYYALPLFIITVFYVAMARHLFLSTRNLPGDSARQVRARKKVAKMVMAFVFIFAICFLPQHVVMIWFYHYPNAHEEYNAFWHTLRITGTCMSYINSCINPIALFCVSGAFRKYFKRYLLCCLKPDLVRSQSVSVTSTRRLGTIRTSVRKDKTWESVSTGNNYQLHHTIKGHTTMIPEVTVTTFINGGNGVEISKN